MGDDFRLPQRDSSITLSRGSTSEPGGLITHTSGI
jgi:hypothetical protein